MSAFVDAFKVKPLDLKEIESSWPDAPRFYGQDPNKKSKGGVRDLPVEQWIKVIRAGCKQRDVVKDSWHRVARHYMGESALKRLDEVDKVMQQMHNGKYRWDWKKYKTAMLNMCWDLDIKKTETLKVHARASSSGLWWITGRREKAESTSSSSTMTSQHSSSSSSSSSNSALPRPEPRRSMTIPWITRNPTPSDTNSISADRPSQESEKRPTQHLSRQSSLASDIKFWPDLMVKLKGTGSAKSDVDSDTAKQQSSASVEKPSKAEDFVLLDEKGEEATTEAPTWLLNACNALDYLSTEHSKVMSTVGAILITIGSIPSIPVVAAGGGGALLASHAVQAIGTIAVSVGSLLKSQGDSKAAEESVVAETKTK